ncbi:MAG: hypothetical protein QW063_00335 [Candidatus Nanoarchaeia archaeon]
MTTAQIISKEPIAIPQLNKFLKEVKKEERSEIQNKIIDYSKKASKLSEADCKALIEELIGLGIPGFTEDLAVALANILPVTLTEIRTLLAGKSNLNPENFKKIQEILMKYSSKGK